MRLYIVRHAYAGQHGDPDYPDDTLRPLTKRGRKHFSRLVKKLAKRGFAPTLLVTSPLVRCRQTAEAIAERFDDPPRILENTDLQPGSNLEGLIHWSNEHAVDEMAWVGHAPDVDRLAGSLIGSGDALPFEKGAVAAIDFDGPIAPGAGTLQWFVSPQVLGC